MMGGRNNDLDSIDRISREIVKAARVSDEEVETTATSPDLYRRVRLQIASRSDSTASIARRSADRTTPRPIVAPVLAVFGSRLRLTWAFAGVVALLVLAILTAHFVTRPSTDQISSVQQATAAHGDTHAPGGGPAGTSNSEAVAPDKKTVDRPIKIKPRSVRRRLGAMPPDTYTAEVATDFLPLTYIADSAQMDSAHVVRVKMPRSALVSFGLPMNYERASELVKADVLIGDDGLARAIRFVQ